MAHPQRAEIFDLPEPRSTKCCPGTIHRSRTLLADRYSRWPELSLHQAITFLSSGTICEREGSEKFFPVTGMVASQPGEPFAGG